MDYSLGGENVGIWKETVVASRHSPGEENRRQCLCGLLVTWLQHQPSRQIVSGFSAPCPLVTELGVRKPRSANVFCAARVRFL
jgi:hypothetical protein